MLSENQRTGLQLRSLVKRSGELELSLATVEVPRPGPDEVVVRVEAAPINPSDLGLLLAFTDARGARQTGTREQPVVTARVPEAALKSMAARLDVSMPVGNEGAGHVVEAGASPAAQALKGKLVSLFGGAMYAQYRVARADEVMALPEGISAADGASAFVNPMTALGMLETLRREGHKAMVHTAAASSLGQMLVRLMREEKVPLINVVRKPEQAQLLRELGAEHVVDSSAPDFAAQLTDAIAATGATLAFDATGGGKLPNLLLSCMETALNRQAKVYSRYGNPTHKQVYIYGALDTGPTELIRSYGMAWSVGGWLVSWFLQKIGAADAARLRQRAIAGLETTFATKYAREISLAEALDLENLAAYGARATGGKFLINPNK